jgi:eukaryotic-like serine/threonine-protein kinase
MPYCINPNCTDRDHPDNTSDRCPICHTSFLIHNGKFRILEGISVNSIDRSSPWEVFKVKELDTGKFKILKTLCDSNGIYPELFQREITALRTFNHLGISGYHREFIISPTGKNKQGFSYLIMEWINGEDLGRWFQQNGRLTDRNTIILWLKQITKILEYIHNRNYIHCDIKPDNILFRRDDPQGLVLIDFGMAEEITSVQTNNRLGTSNRKNLDYAAPDQIRNNMKPCLQSDFYALGKTFIYLLTGASQPLDKFNVLKENRWAIVEYDGTFHDTGIIPVIEWLVNDNYWDRPHTSKEILKVISYISKQNNQNSYPNNLATGKFIGRIIRARINPISKLIAGCRKLIGFLPTGLSKIKPCIDSLSKLEIALTIAVITFLLAITIGISTGHITFGNNNNRNNAGNTIKNPTTPSSTVVSTIEELISFGDRDIGENPLTKEDRKLMTEGIKYFNSKKPGHYKNAYNKFYELRQFAETERNLPEQDRKHAAVIKYPNLLIYMNNARVRYWHEQHPTSKIHTIVAALPVYNVGRGKQILYGVAHAQSIATLPIDSVRRKVFYGEEARSNASALKITENNIDKEPKVYLEIGIANDRQAPGTAKKIAQQLIKTSITGEDGQERTIMAVVGHYTSEVTCEAVSVYSTANLPIISPASTLKLLRDRCEDKNHVFFRTASSTQYESGGFIQYLKYFKGKTANFNEFKIISFHKKGKKEQNTNEFSQDLFNRFNEDLGDDRLLNKKIDYQFNMGDPNDFENGLKNIHDHPQNIIILLPDGQGNPESTFDRAVKVLDKADLKETQLIIASNPLLTILKSEKDENLLKKWQGKLIGAVDWHGLTLIKGDLESYSCGNKIFIKEMMNLWDGNLNRTTAQSYEAVQVLSNIFNKYEIKTRGNLLYQLKQRNNNINSDIFDRPRPISFDDKGDRDYTQPRILITPDKDGTRFIPIDDNQCH